MGRVKQFVAMSGNIGSGKLVVYLRAPVEVLLARFDLCPLLTLEAHEVDLTRLEDVTAQIAPHIPPAALVERRP